MLHNDGTKYSDGLIPQGASIPSLSGLVEARIDEILYTDNSKNSTRVKEYKEVEYNCTIVGGPLDGMRLFHVRDTVRYGGQYNKSGQVRSPVRKGKLEPPIDKPQKTDGDFVLIAIPDGNPYRARIIQGVPHPLGNALDITSKDGIQEIVEFNGMEIKTDKNGALTITNKGGPKDVNGIPTKPDAEGAEIKMDVDGAMSMAKGTKKIELDKDGQVGLAGPNGATLDLKTGGACEMVNKQMDVQAKNALNIKSSLTKIGNGGVPSARIGDMVVGTGNQGAPVVSKIIQGSYISMVGS